MKAEKEVNLWALGDLCTPWCIHVAATLRIADHLAAGIDQIDDLARAAGVTGRVTTAGQSFFEPLPAGADLYLLRGIINDFPDREAVTVLQRCAEAARPAGQVVVLKGVGPEDAHKDLTIEMILLGEGLTNPQIAARLYISSDTVKAHTAAIFRKLDSSNRTQAVTVARNLGVIN